MEPTSQQMRRIACLEICTKQLRKIKWTQNSINFDRFMASFVRKKHRSWFPL